MDSRIVEITTEQDDPRAIEMRISAFMYYPSDTVARGNWMLRNIVQFIALLDREATSGDVASGVPNGDIEAFRRELGAYLGSNVHDYGGWQSFAYAVLGKKTAGAQSESNTRIALGKHAGAVLTVLLTDETCRGVKDAAGKVVAGLKGTSNPRILHPESLYQKVWHEFRPVAHLWAAFLTPGAFEHCSKGPWLPLTKFNYGGLQGFLKHAEEIRCAGEKAFAQHGRKVAALPQGECWVIR